MSDASLISSPRAATRPGSARSEARKAHARGVALLGDLDRLPGGAAYARAALASLGARTPSAVPAGHGDRLEAVAQAARRLFEDGVPPNANLIASAAARAAQEARARPGSASPSLAAMRRRARAPLVPTVFRDPAPSELSVPGADTGILAFYLRNGSEDASGEFIPVARWERPVICLTGPRSAFKIGDVRTGGFGVSVALDADHLQEVLVEFAAGTTSARRSQLALFLRRCADQLDEASAALDAQGLD